MACGLAGIGRSMAVVVLLAATMALLPGVAPGLGQGEARAAHASCKQLFKLKSKDSKTKTTITFVNTSKTQRALLWLDFTGQPKDYGNVAPGQEKTIQTFMTHPWMVATGPGDCLHIVLPSKDAAGTRVIMADKGVEVAADGGPQDHGDPPVIVCEKAGMDYDGAACVPRKGKPKGTGPQAAGGDGDKPSWCAAAKLPAEHAICGNPRLGKLDGVLNVAYTRANGDSPKKRAEIDHEHRRWRGRRDACGNDGGCIERRYLEQIAFLESFYSN